jgi:hypothetical protein
MCIMTCTGGAAGHHSAAAIWVGVATGGALAAADRGWW